MLLSEKRRSISRLKRKKRHKNDVEGAAGTGRLTVEHVRLMLSDSASSYDDDKRLWCKILICPAFLKGGTSQSLSDPHNQIETRIIIIIIM